VECSRSFESLVITWLPSTSCASPYNVNHSWTIRPLTSAKWSWSVESNSRSCTNSYLDTSLVLSSW
jgi:hypothetical protein